MVSNSLIDTHTHQYSEELQIDLQVAMQGCIDANIEYCLLPNIDKDSIEPMLALEAAYPKLCKSMMGLHPCYVKEDFKAQLNTVETWLQKRDFVAIGEIGLDLYWDKTFFEEQKITLETQLIWALERQMPVSIHCRNAHNELMQVLRKMKEIPIGVYHCFSGNIEQAKEALSFGKLKLGIGGVVTFKNSGLDKVVEYLDLSDIVLETDAPYLAPLPHRGKRNESAYLPLIAEKIASIKGINIADVAHVTTQNAKTIFNLA
jgi:TatD DNase family protein